MLTSCAPILICYFQKPRNPDTSKLQSFSTYFHHYLWRTWLKSKHFIWFRVFCIALGLNLNPSYYHKKVYLNIFILEVENYFNLNFTTIALTLFTSATLELNMISIISLSPHQITCQISDSVSTKYFNTVLLSERTTGTQELIVRSWMFWVEFLVLLR